jgi:cell division protein FtsL
MKRRRARRSVAFYIVVAAVSAGAAALAHVWVRMQVVELGYEAAREKQTALDLGGANQRLRIEVAGLSNPARVEQLAQRELRMAPPDPAHIRVVGTPVASAPSRVGRNASWRLPRPHAQD